MSVLLTVEEALALVLARTTASPAQDVALDASLGRVLAEDVQADGDYPAWPRSKVDGYAVSKAQGAFDIAFETAAGAMPLRLLRENEAARIFTGAPVPDGADRVVKQEDVRVEAGRVHIDGARPSGENITPRGMEASAGAVVAARGELVTPGVVGALASVGKATVRVAVAPRVVVLPTGSELVPVGEAPPPGRIRNSNAPALVAAMNDCGAAASAAPIAPDTRPALDDALKTALADDPAIVLLTGGVSVGDYDLVPAALADAGVERVFHGVALQPGKPLWFGVRGATLVFGLPGNPVSALVNAALFVRPAVRKMLGRADFLPTAHAALLGGDLGKGTWRRRYVPAKTRIDGEGRLVATPVRFAGSGDVFGFAKADALIVVAENAARRAAGERCEVVSLADGR